MTRGDTPGDVRVYVCNARVPDVGDPATLNLISRDRLTVDHYDFTVAHLDNGPPVNLRDDPPACVAFNHPSHGGATEDLARREVSIKVAGNATLDLARLKVCLDAFLGKALPVTVTREVVQVFIGVDVQLDPERLDHLQKEEPMSTTPLGTGHLVKREDVRHFRARVLGRGLNVRNELFPPQPALACVPGS